MTGFELGLLVSRILAIVALINALTRFPVFFSLDISQLVSTLPFPVAALVVAAILWFKADAVAALLVGEPDHEELAPPDFDFRRVVTASVSVVGLALVALRGIPFLFGTLGAAIFQLTSPNTTPGRMFIPTPWLQVTVTLILDVVLIVIGLWLFLRPQAVARLITQRTEVAE